MVRFEGRSHGELDVGETMRGFYREDIIVGVMKVLERGDQDNQPWAFYAHDHGGLKGHEWTEENAQVERSNFIEELIAEMERTSAR